MRGNDYEFPGLVAQSGHSAAITALTRVPRAGLLACIGEDVEKLERGVSRFARGGIFMRRCI